MRISSNLIFRGCLFFTGLSVYVLPSAAKPQPDATSRCPNIVLIVADDLGYGELGCQGNPQIPTPHIDSLARDGVRFTDAYVTASFCSASRAGLMTGRYQTRFGYEFNPIGARNEDPEAGLPPAEATLADLLRGAGYTTALIGKWHLGGTANYNPMRRGFDEFFGFLHEGHYFVPPPWHGVTTMLRRKVLPPGAVDDRWTAAGGKLVYTSHMGSNEPDYDADNPIYRGGQPVEESEYLTDALTREAVDFIGRNRDRPFFLYLPYNAVHSPLQGADVWMEKFAAIEDVHRRIFAAMLGNLDAGVGEVLSKIREEGLDESTLVFFISDNGGPTRELTSSNLPLRSGKGSLYEGGVRVPFLARWSGTLPAGKVFQKPVLSLDIYATAAAVSGAPLPRGMKPDGVNLIPWLTREAEVGGRAPHETIYWRIGDKAALRSGDWKLVKNPGRGEPPGWQLFNLASDVSETKDLAETNPEKAAELLAAWEKLNGEMMEPVWK